MDSMFIFLPLLIIVVYFYIRQNSRYNKLHERFKNVTDIDSEISKGNRKLEEIQTKINETNTDYKNRIEEYKKKLKDFQDLTDIQLEITKENQKLSEIQAKTSEMVLDYKNKRTIYDKLLSEINIIEENLEAVSYGLYKPHFDFDTSSEYQKRILTNHQRQKQFLKDKVACTCSKEWIVEGDEKKGAEMIARNTKLALRAFNGECDAAAQKVKWNNMSKMEERVEKAYKEINKLVAPLYMKIENRYFSLKMEELHLVYEHQEKLYKEKEEQRAVKEQMKEEERAIKEFETAKRAAENEERIYQKSLDEARKEIETAKSEEVMQLNDKILSLEKQLKEVQEKKRAISIAQVTKSGYVYVISNIGSFGENIYKIGMTRRLQPEDRVREFSVSVPFEFDVHALIRSENAPELEAELHKRFEEKRLNLVNNRKEFYHVALQEIETAVKDLHGNIEFTKIAEAKQYRQTLALRENAKMSSKIAEQIQTEFPLTI
jgi:T5orf172 domain.